MAVSIPPELLYQVVCLVVAEYVDEVVAGSLQIPQDQEPPVQDEPESQQQRTKPKETSPLPEPKSILSLLTASYQLRSVTLKVLSDAFEIPVVDGVVESLATNPWDVLQQARLKWQHAGDAAVKAPLPCSDLLRRYMILGLVQYQYIVLQPPCMVEVTDELQRVPNSPLESYIYPRILGAHAYALSFIIRDRGLAIESSLEFLSKPVGEDEELHSQYMDICNDEVESMIETLHLMRTCCNLKMNIYQAQPQPAEQEYTPAPLASGLISFTPLRNALESLLERFVEPNEREEECVAVARDVVDNWGEYFPREVCPFSAPVVSLAKPETSVTL